MSYRPAWANDKRETMLQWHLEAVIDDMRGGVHSMQGWRAILTGNEEPRISDVYRHYLKDVINYLQKLLAEADAVADRNAGNKEDRP